MLDRSKVKQARNNDGAEIAASLLILDEGGDFFLYFQIRLGTHVAISQCHFFPLIKSELFIRLRLTRRDNL